MNVESPVSGSSGRLRRLAVSLNLQGVSSLILLAICIALVLPAFGGDEWRDAWRYERTAIAAGEWWRFATGHLVHLDLEHAILNALGLVLMWALFASDYRPRAWLAIVLASAVLIDAGFWFRDRTLEWYVGSSGVLHGVMAAGTLARIVRRDLDGWILGAFIAAKLAYEQYTGALPFAEGGAPVVVNAHLYGAIGGLLAAAAFRPWRRVAWNQSL